MKKLFQKFSILKKELAYLKMQQRQKRELRQLIKYTFYDFSPIYFNELVFIKIKHIYEYFSLNYNIWYSEEVKAKLLEQLQHILNLIKQVDDLWASYKQNEVEDNYVNAKKYLNLLSKEGELYKEIYISIGKLVQFWNSQN